MEAEAEAESAGDVVLKDDLRNRRGISALFLPKQATAPFQLS